MDSAVAAAHRPLASWRTWLRHGYRTVREANWQVQVGGALVLMFVVMAVVPGIIAHHSTTELAIEDRFLNPSWSHPFGTDALGRDIFSRVVHGTRYTLGMTISIIVIAAFIGTLIGLASGLGGRLVDQLLMRLTDVFLALPTFVLAMALSVALGRSMVSLVEAMAVAWWPSYARMVRSMVLSIGARPHVLSARAIGVGPWRMMRHHILPFASGELIVKMTQDLGYCIVAVSGLGFIGLGAHEPTPEWGLLMSDAKANLTNSWSYVVFCGLVIVLATLAFGWLGTGLSELRHRHERRG